MRTIYQWHRWDQRTNVKTGERRKNGHRIRHYGLFANGNRANNIALARRLLGAPDPAPWSADVDRADGSHEHEEWNICPCCGGRMVIVETFGPGCQPRLWLIPAITFDSS